MERISKEEENIIRITRNIGKLSRELHREYKKNKDPFTIAIIQARAGFATQIDELLENDEINKK
ncbi:hypothetical protein [Bacteroides sp.]|uniref:hypothetical protein n=1 Tax=Bacteroides sp. TaxID=29523 RepID=UPI003AB423E9